MDKTAIILLAAGLGKRLGFGLPKAAVCIENKPIVLHMLGAVSKIKPDRIILVTGYKRELVEQIVRDGAQSEGCSLSDLSFAFQAEQLGTGHAVQSAMEVLGSFTGTVLILYGDMPLIRHQTLSALLEAHRRNKASLSFVSLISDRPNSYGRVIRDHSSGLVTKVVEARDRSPQESLINEFNAGIYAVNSAFLASAIKSLGRQNSQSEYYLTDIIAQAVKEGQTVVTYPLRDAEELQGVNDLFDLTLVNKTLNARRVRELILSGALVQDPGSLYLDPQVQVAPGARIGPQVQLYGNTTIASGAVIDGLSLLRDTTVEKNAHLKLGINAEKAVIGEDATVGPFANLREGTILGPKTRIGNFVETKKAVLGEGSKAPHLTYLGDCSVGQYTNIGAGTITCNYDGYKKHQTTIGNNVFIGSNSALIAPLSIEDGAIVGAGSVITKKVEKDSLALTRAPQISTPGWARVRRERMAEK